MTRTVEEIKENIDYRFADNARFRFVYEDSFSSYGIKDGNVDAGDRNFYDPVSKIMLELYGPSFAFADAKKGKDMLAQMIYDNTEKAKSHINFKVNNDEFGVLYDDIYLYSYDAAWEFKDKAGRAYRGVGIWSGKEGTRLKRDMYIDTEKFKERESGLRDMFASMVGVYVTRYPTYYNVNFNKFDMSNLTKNNYGNIDNIKDCIKEFPVGDYIGELSMMYLDSDLTCSEPVTLKNRIKGDGSRPLPNMDITDNVGKQYPDIV